LPVAEDSRLHRRGRPHARARHWIEAAMTGLVDAQSCTKTAVGSPPFSIQEEDKTAWLVRPNGERFFSLGVCCVNQGASPEEFDSGNPGYAARQHYADSNRWAETTLRRLKDWGFTTVG